MSDPARGVSFTLGQIAEHVGGTLEGSPDVSVTGVAGIDDAAPGDLTFVASSKYADALTSTQAAAVLVAPDLSCPKELPVIRTRDPYSAMMRVLCLFDPGPPPVADGVHPSAVVAEDVKIPENCGVGACAVVESGVVLGAGTRIGAQCVVGVGARLGADCYLHPRVYVGSRCVLGDRVVLQPGVVIGGDGFGFAPVDGRYHKIPQLGIVQIDDDVEIGANSCVDRATMGRTHIGRGTKIDNLVQVAHNVSLGEDVALVSQVGISGSARIGNRVRFGGQAGTVGHIEIGEGATVAARGAVIGDVPAGQMVSGYPARPHRETLRAEAALRRLPKLVKLLRALDPERTSKEEESQ